MSTIPFGGLEVFLAIAEQGSLRRAADVLGVQPPAVSYRLRALEEQIGSALFIRTTRSVKLTEAGRSLLARAKPAMLQLGEAVEDARGAGGSRKGTIRISLPEVAYQLTIAPHLAAFQRTYPDIEVELSFNDAFVDIVAEGFHAGMRLGDHIRDEMVAVRLSPPLKQVVFGAPSYFDRAGRPEQPADLLRNNCIRYRYIASTRFAEWQFRGDEGVTTIDVRGNLIVNSTNALVSAASDGLGVGWLFEPSVEDAMHAGRLESVLDRYAIERPGYFLYFAKANSRIEALRVFIDFMREHAMENRHARHR